MVSKVEKTGKPGRPKGIAKTGGRKKGVPNKATASIKEAAQQYTDRALLVLAEVMADEDQPAAARVSAVKEILDRGYGKASQSVDVAGELKFAGLDVTVIE